MEQIWGSWLSCKWDFLWWTVNARRLVKELPHSWQVKETATLWYLLSCLARSHECWKVRSHCEQWNGLSPVWVSWCLLTSDVRVNILPQVSHVRAFCRLLGWEAFPEQSLMSWSSALLCSVIPLGKSFIDVKISSSLEGDGVNLAPERFLYTSVGTLCMWKWGGLFASASWKGHFKQVKMMEVISSESPVNEKKTRHWVKYEGLSWKRNTFIWEKWFEGFCIISLIPLDNTLQKDKSKLFFLKWMHPYAPLNINYVTSKCYLCQFL